MPRTFARAKHDGGNDLNKKDNDGNAEETATADNKSDIKIPAPIAFR